MTRLGALRVLDRDAWQREVLALLRAHGGNRTRAAQAAGVSHRQWARWMREIGVPVEVNQHSLRSVDTNVIAKTPGKQ